MYNWSIDVKKLKQDTRKYSTWKLEQMVNFGLAGHKLSAKQLRQYWHEIDIDPARRNFLNLILNA